MEMYKKTSEQTSEKANVKASEKLKGNDKKISEGVMCTRFKMICVFMYL